MGRELGADEPLSAEGFEECFGEGFVVAAGVAAVGEHLSERLLVVDFNEVAVLGQVFFLVVEAVDALGGVVVVGLAVDDGLYGQAVGEGRLLVGPAEGDGGDGEDEPGQCEDVDDGFGHVDGCPEVAQTESFGFGKVAEGLTVEQGVGGCVEERQGVVVAGVGLSLFGPAGGAAEVGAEGEHDGCLGDHGLVEMGRCQLGFLVGIAGDDDAVELQVSHGLGALGIGEQAEEQLVVDVARSVLPDGAAGVDVIH